MEQEQEEAHILADLSILDFYLHRSIQTRLENFGCCDGDSESSLHQAYLQSVIVEDILKMLAVTFESYDDIPFDPILQKRLQFGAALGLLSFYNKDSPESKFEGYAKALPLLSLIVQSSSSSSLQKYVLELKKILMLWKCSNKDLALGAFDETFGTDLTPQELIDGKRVLMTLEKDDQYQESRKDILSPSNLMACESMIVEALADVYMMIEPPLIAKMSSRRESVIVASKEKETAERTEESQPSFGPYTQAPYATQKFEVESIGIASQLLESSQLPGQPNPLMTEATLPPSTQGTIASLNCSGILPTSPAILPKSSQEPSGQQESEEILPAIQEVVESCTIDQQPGPITKIPFEVFSKLLEICGEDADTFFFAKDATIDKAYAVYEEFSKAAMKDEALPPLETLLPKDSSPVRPATKKKAVFESEQDFEPEEKVNSKKKSLLLPDETSKKVVWDSLVPSSPSCKENNSTSTTQNTVTSNESNEKPSADIIPKRLMSVHDSPEQPNPKKIKFAKGRRTFNQQEVNHLKDGLRRFGRKWSIILATYPFNDRTQGDLKDKARNLAKTGQIVLPEESARKKKTK